MKKYKEKLLEQFKNLLSTCCEEFYEECLFQGVVYLKDDIGLPFDFGKKIIEVKNSHGCSSLSPGTFTNSDREIIEINEKEMFVIPEECWVKYY